MSSVSTIPASLGEVRAKVGAVPDPEIPVVTLSELGILRDVRLDEAGQPLVVLTPTYSGCPATEAIAADVRRVLGELGYPNGQVKITLSPPWTTDWISDVAREKLRAYGIAPPGRCTDAAQVIHFTNGRTIEADSKQIRCPRCDSEQTELVSAFGSTPCKSHHRCKACQEPFDYFKPF